LAADADAYVCNGEAHGHQGEVSSADRPLIIISVRVTEFMRRTMIAQMMTSNYVTKAYLNI
jgi:hypothetical protein